MAHEIMGQRFIARSKPAWHNIAQRICSSAWSRAQEEYDRACEPYACAR